MRICSNTTRIDPEGHRPSGSYYKQRYDTRSFGNRAFVDELDFGTFCPEVGSLRHFLCRDILFGRHLVFKVPLIDEPPADEAASSEIDPEQAAQIEFEEAVRRRKEAAEKDCTEVGPGEKSEPTAEERAREQ